MTSIFQTLRMDRTGQIILAASAFFALVYLFDDFGVGAPYPLDVAIKAAGIVLLAVFALRQGHAILALGLFLGSLGDTFLALEPSQLPLGIAAFGLGHLVYIFLFARIRMEQGGRGSWSRIAALAIAAYGFAMLSWLQPYFGDLRLAASIYNGIILVMTILAILGRAPGLALAGALLFLVSDSVLAVRLFTGHLEWAGPVVWVTYYLGQAGIAARPRRVPSGAGRRWSGVSQAHAPVRTRQMAPSPPTDGPNSLAIAGAPRIDQRLSANSGVGVASESGSAGVRAGLR